MYPTNEPLVSTIKERCRVCYTCVRECPAKAIRIVEQQAEVIPQRCIGCGNCVQVCSQHAKQVLSGIESVFALLDSEQRVAACVAPSFPAEFPELDGEVVVGMIRTLGFALVNEVSFGADLVARAHRRLLSEHPDQRYISTSCPAVVGYVERYHPDLVDRLAPIVSPMVATAKAMRVEYGQDIKIVFIGPCIAKKGEYSDGEIDGALSFAELRSMFETRGISPDTTKPSDFDPPYGGKGALFPIGGGMLQAADLEEDLITGDVVTATGRPDFSEAIKEFGAGDLDARLLEVLCCKGCIMGPGFKTKAPLFRRRAKVSQYVRRRMGRFDRSKWQKDMSRFANLDLSRTFRPYDQRIAAPSIDDIREILARMGKHKPEDELNCGACGYETCHEHAIAIHKHLAESEMCLPYTIEQLKKTCSELTCSNQQLASTQEALMQSEKLASMGQLAAGIAHEVNNPLGTVLMLSNILLDEADPNSSMREDLGMIAGEAERCKKIVAGLLHFARKNKVEAKHVDLRDLVDQAMRSVPVNGKVESIIQQEDVDSYAEIDRDQVLQVLINLISNAVAAMPDGGTLTICIGGDKEDIRLTVTDTGVGIKKDDMGKIFEPFYTTKPAGQGTGLGLAVSYGVVKMHRGDIRVESNADESTGPTGTTFTVVLPRRRSS